jgi:hypothetical protein
MACPDRTGMLYKTSDGQKKAACQLPIFLRTAKRKRRNFVDVISAD